MGAPLTPSMKKEEFVQLTVKATCNPPPSKPDEPGETQDNPEFDGDAAASGSELITQGVATPWLTQPPSATGGDALSPVTDYRLRTAYISRPCNRFRNISIPCS